MSGPLDKDDAFWNNVFSDVNAVRAWNAALWEAKKLFEACPPIERDDVFKALENMTKRKVNAT